MSHYAKNVAFFLCFYSTRINVDISTFLFLHADGVGDRKEHKDVVFLEEMLTHL